MEILLTINTKNGVSKNKKIYFEKGKWFSYYVVRLKKYIIELYDKFNTALLSCNDEIEMIEFNLTEYNVTLKFDGEIISFFDENTGTRCDEIMFSILTNDFYNAVKTGRLSLKDCIIKCLEKHGTVRNNDYNYSALYKISDYNNYCYGNNCAITKLALDSSNFKDKIILNILCNDKFGNETELECYFTDFDLDSSGDYVYNDVDNKYKPVSFNQDDFLRMLIVSVLVL